MVSQLRRRAGWPGGHQAADTEELGRKYTLWVTTLVTYLSASQKQVNCVTPLIRPPSKSAANAHTRPFGDVLDLNHSKNGHKITSAY